MRCKKYNLEVTGCSKQVSVPVDYICENCVSEALKTKGKGKIATPEKPCDLKRYNIDFLQAEAFCDAENEVLQTIQPMEVM